MTESHSAHPLRIRRSSVVSLFFVVGVLSQNVQVLPIGSEYQPWFYCSVLPFAFSMGWVANAKLSRARLLVSLLLGACFLMLLVLAMTQTMVVPVKDAARVLALPIVAVATLIYLREASDSAVRFIIWLHISILALALAAPEAAVAVAAVFGGRGQSYYLGWNSYFYSEPSYAALTFLFLAFFLVRKGPLRLMDSLALLALLTSTLSVTGIFGAAIVGGTFVWQRSRAVFAAACAVLFFGVISLSMIPADTPVRTLQRLASVADAVESMHGRGAGSVLLLLNIAEPSGMWRVTSNLYAMSCANHVPLGLGNTDVYSVLGRSECSDVLASVLRQNPTFGRLGPGASAQSVLGNLAIFAGAPGMLLGIVLLCVQFSAFRYAYVRAALPLSLAFVLFFIVWQSAWAAPTASLMIAAAYAHRRRHEIPEDAGSAHG